MNKRVVIALKDAVDPSAGRGHDLRPALPAWCFLFDMAEETMTTIDEQACALFHLGGRPVTVMLGETVGERTSLKPGEVALAAAGTLLRLSASAPARLLVLMFDESLIRSGPLPVLARPAGCHRLHSGFEPAPSPAEAMASALAQELEDKRDGRAAVRSALMLALIEHLASSPQFSTETEAPSAFAQSGIERLLKLIDERLSSHLSLDKLAKAAGVSPYYLSRSFRSTMGVNIYSYIRERRLKLACRLLAETRKPLAEIAYESGFSSQSRMNTVFRQGLDSTPLAYRRRCWDKEDHRTPCSARPAGQPERVPLVRHEPHPENV